MFSSLCTSYSSGLSRRRARMASSFFTLSIALVLLLHLTICKIIPDLVSKGLLKYGCSTDQLSGLEQLLLSHRNGFKDKMVLSFLSGKKQRKKAKKLIAQHCPFLKVHKCKIESSYCLALRTSGESPKDSEASDLDSAPFDDKQVFEQRKDVKSHLSEPEVIFGC